MKLWSFPLTGTIALGMSVLLHVAPALTQAPATRLFFLDIRGGRVVSTSPEGSDEPIDLDLDLAQRMVYWTDRGDGPRGNTVSRAPMSPRPGVNPSSRTDPQILLRNLKEGIGMALDLQAGRLYATDLGGTVYSARLDGSDQKVVLTGQGSLTGMRSST